MKADRYRLFDLVKSLLGVVIVFGAIFLLANRSDYLVVGSKIGQEAASSTVTRRCSASDFQVKQLSTLDQRKFNDGRDVWIVGEIVNNCNKAAGPELNVMVRNTDGTIASATYFSPDSLNNIPAHSSFAFEYFIPTPPEGAKLEASVRRIDYWRD